MIKRKSGNVKNRYRGLAQNCRRNFTLFAVGKLFLSGGGFWLEAEPSQKRKSSGGDRALQDPVLKPLAHPKASIR